MRLIWDGITFDRISSKISEADIGMVNQLFEDMKLEALKEFETLKISAKDVIFEKSADIRYAGQYHELEMPLPAHDITFKGH